MKFFYGSATMGENGNGYFWHRLYKFPKLEMVTKTITLDPKEGYPYRIMWLYNSVYNNVKLHNPGIKIWRKNQNRKYCHRMVLSIAGTYDELCKMIEETEYMQLIGYELNLSCPNHETFELKKLPKVPDNRKLYIKLSHDQNPYDYDLTKVDGIRLNSVKVQIIDGALSGKMAQKKNWAFLEKHQDLNKEIPIAASSWYNQEHIDYLKELGYNQFQIGSVMLINPKFVETIESVY